MRPSSLRSLTNILFIVFEKTAYNFDFIASNYLNFYNDIVEKEIELADFSQEDSILVIGCGSLPATSILISMKTKAKLVSIDKDRGAIKKASKFIAKQNFENRIILEHANALFYPVEKFDIIFLTYGLIKQKEIFNYLSKSVKDTARIIFRTTPDLQVKIRGGQSDFFPFFIVKKCVGSELFGQIDSYLLEKIFSKK